MNRRSFIGRTVLALVALSTPVIMTGCNWATDLLNWIPIGISAVNGVLSLLAGAGIVLGPGVVVIIGLIQAGLTDLKLAIVEYQSTTPPPAGALAKIDTFLSDLVSNIGNVVSQLPAGNIIGLAISLLMLVLDTIAGFLQKAPAIATTFIKTRAAMQNQIHHVNQNGTTSIIPISAVTNLSRRHFIKTYNTLLVAGGHPEQKLPESFVQHF